MKSENVDVVIPVYNGEKFILNAIKSVDNQTKPPEKIIVVNDGSTDSTEPLVRSYRSRTQLIYVVKQNGGECSARNAGLELCASEYVAFLDHDDEWMPNKLELQLRTFLMPRFSKLGVVYCDYVLIDEDGKDLFRHPSACLRKNMKGNVFDKLLVGNRISSSASGVLIRRSCFDVAGLFDEELRFAGDWDMWLRISRTFDFDYVDCSLVRIRRHSGSIQQNESKVFQHEMKFYSKWAEAPDIPAKVLRLWRRYLSWKVLETLPKMGNFKLLEQGLTDHSKRKLFGMTSYSLRLFFIGRAFLLTVSSLWPILKRFLATVRALLTRQS